MVNEKAKLIVEKAYDAILVSLEKLEIDDDVGFLDRQVVLGSIIDSSAQLVSVDIGLAKK